MKIIAVIVEVQVIERILSDWLLQTRARPHAAGGLSISALSPFRRADAQSCWERLRPGGAAALSAGCAERGR
ncbi:MAG: hypothetical protein OEU93_18365 [Rubrivivax sp.]|nr:hypothetical protein [Rubrivivax sp.]